jgi:hypothetical protein
MFNDWAGTLVQHSTFNIEHSTFNIAFCRSVRQRVVRGHYIFPRSMNSALTIDSKSSFFSAARYAVSGLI